MKILIMLTTFLAASSYANTSSEVIQAFQNQFGNGQNEFHVSLPGKTDAGKDCKVSIRVVRDYRSEVDYMIKVDAYTTNIHYKPATFPMYLSSFKGKKEIQKTSDLSVSTTGELESTKLKFKEIETYVKNTFHRSWDVFSNFNTHKIDFKKQDSGYNVRISFQNHYPVLGLTDSYSAQCVTDSTKPEN